MGPPLGAGGGPHRIFHGGQGVGGEASLEAPDDREAEAGEPVAGAGEGEEVYQSLQNALDEFRNCAPFFYAMARYACALDRLDEAEKCLKRACELGGKEVKLRALDDPDLKRVWHRRHQGSRQT